MTNRALASCISLCAYGCVTGLAAREPATLHAFTTPIQCKTFSAAVVSQCESIREEDGFPRCKEQRLDVLPSSTTETPHSRILFKGRGAEEFIYRWHAHGWRCLDSRQHGELLVLEISNWQYQLDEDLWLIDSQGKKLSKPEVVRVLQSTQWKHLHNGGATEYSGSINWPPFE